eukprot:snap_masked-scaffold_60-processed-gene-0.31-mRNA-1 protein AED:1.00 eAED:1.00 QI:0/-1/0/0/-1/1/1/0/128
MGRRMRKRKCPHTRYGELQNIAADYKLKKDWTKKEKREYNARAVRKHRLKAKAELCFQYERMMELQKDLIKLKRRETELRQLCDVFQNERARECWSKKYLLQQNGALRYSIRRIHHLSRAINYAIKTE